MFRRVLVVFGLVGVLLAGSGVAEAAGPLPKGCVLQAGRFQVLPIVGAHHAVQVTTVGVAGCKQAALINQSVYVLRWWTSTRTWTVERSWKSGVEWMKSLPQNVAAACATPGALMGLRVAYTYRISGTVLDTFTYQGRTTALCPT